MSKPIRQHIVPRMLLREFSTALGSERVWVLDVAEDAVPRRSGLDNTTVAKHYYTLFRDRPSKPDDWWWEDLLAEWEGKAAEAMRALESDRTKLRAPLGLFVSLQLLRTPLGHAMLADEAEDERRKVFGAADDQGWARWWIERKRRIPELHEWVALREAASAARRGKPHQLLTADATTVLDQMMVVLHRSGFAERLWDQGDWNVLHADGDAEFVLGDTPVTYRRQDNPARPIWRQDQLPEQLTMPLGPTRCLEVRREPRLEPLTEDDIDEINLRAWGWATRCVIGADDQTLLGVRQKATGRQNLSTGPLTRNPRRMR